jgi:ABC-2 type transport system permease protein
MRYFFTLLRHELRNLCLAPATYIAAFLFLLLMGFIFQHVVETFNQGPEETIPLVVFVQAFWIPVFFMVPLLTMKSFAEEKRQGTLETLLTTPVSSGEVVLAKFSASYLLYLFLWLITIGFNLILYHLVGDARLLETGPMIGGYLFILLSGLLFIAVGIFSSSLTRNQLVAGILCFSLLFALIVGSRYLAELGTMGLQYLPVSRTWVDYLQVFQHVEDFSRGILDTRPIFFYLSTCALFLVLSIRTIESKVWRS